MKTPGELKMKFSVMKDQDLLSESKPPRELFDFFHWLETKGITIPEVIDDWWAYETDLTAEKNCGATR